MGFLQMGMDNLNKGIGRATHIPRQLNILPERAKTVEGVASVATGKKKKKETAKRSLVNQPAVGSSLT